MPTLPTPEPRGPSRTAYLLTHVLGVPALLACLAWWINASGLDMTIARTLFDPAIDDFPLHTSRWLELIGHRMVLALPIGVGLGAVGVALVASRVPAWKPARGVALAVAATCLLGQLAVSQLKHYTTLPRPYDLETLGGYTPYPLHWWTWVRARAGGALPSGHAGAGYAMLSLYFAGWAMGRPAWRWGGLALVGRGPGVFRSPRTARRALPEPDRVVGGPAVVPGGGGVLSADRRARPSGGGLGAGPAVCRHGGRPARKSGHLGGRPDRHRMISGTV